MPALSWTFYQDPFASVGCYALIYAADLLYAGGPDTGSGQTLYVSIDGGVTWNPVVTDPFGVDGVCRALFWDGTNLWAAGHNDGVQPVAWSSDGGATWTYTSTDLADVPFFPSSIAVDDSTVVVVGDSTAAGWSVAISTDGGTTFTYDPSTDPFPTSEPNAVLFDGSTIVVGAASSGAVTIAYSTDTGSTWSNPGTDPFGAGSCNGLTLNGSQLIAAGTDGSAHTIAFSADAGAAWTYPTTDPFPGGGQANGVALNGAQIIAAGLSADTNNSMASSDDGGTTWQFCVGADPFALSGGLGWVVADGENINAGAIDSSVHALAVSIPPVPIIIPGPTGAHSYEVIVCDKWGIAKGQINSAVPTQIEWDLDDLGQALIDFWILDPSSAILPIADIPVIAEVQIWRDQVLIWWGTSVSCTFDKDQVHLTCQGHLWILQQLLFGPVTTNYLLNPSFELGAGTNWSVTADVFVSTVTTPVVLGTYAAQLAQGSTLADRYLYQDYDFTSGGIGDEIDVAAWVWVIPGSWTGPAFQQRGLYIQAVNGDTIVAESFQELTVGTPQGSWQRFETTIEVPPNLDVTIEVRLYAPNATVVWDATNAAIPESVSSELDGSDVFIIISEIIDYAQDPKRGKSPLALQPTTGGLTGTILQRAYQFSDNQGILDALQEFPSIAVCDYEIVFDDTGHFRWLQVYSNPGKGSTKYNYPVEIDLGNVTDLEGGVDGSQTATTQRVLGQGQTGPAAAIGYAAFPSYLGGRVVTDGVFTQGSSTVTSATADFTDADVGLGIYSLHGATQIGSVIESITSSTEVTMSRDAVLTLSDETLGVDGQILDASQSAYPDQPLSTLFGMADAYLIRTMAAQVLPTARTRRDGPHGLMGVVQTGDVIPVMLNYGWLTFGPELMRVAQLIFYPPTEELSMGMMVVNAS